MEVTHLRLGRDEATAESADPVVNESSIHECTLKNYML